MQHFDEQSLSDLGAEIEGWTDSLRHAKSAAEIGRPCEEIWTCRRGLAILHLLLHGDYNAFFQDLARSAQCRLYHLKRCAADSHVDFYCRSTRAEPYWDALAASCFELARDIGRLTPSSFREGEEYEDDFCYLRFLHQWQENNCGASAELSTLLQRFEEVLEGAANPRLAICKSLLGPDGNAFEQAFLALLEERYAQIEREKIGAAEESVCAAVGTYVFVEGLALLRLAGLAGIKTREEYPLCPLLARLPMSLPLPMDGF